MNTVPSLGSTDIRVRWLEDPQHRAWLSGHAHSQFSFFGRCLRAQPGFHVLDINGNPLPKASQELHSTARMVHSYGLGQIAGVPGASEIVDHGMAYLWSHHRDTAHGGYLYSLNEDGLVDDTKLAYGHVFVLLAAATAKIAGHPDADRLLADVSDILETHFWDEDLGRFAEEFNRDWTPFSSYRGMNANMHGVEALLTAFEATEDAVFLSKAGRILDFFVKSIARDYRWRLPEHYTEGWEVDPEYEGNPMFRPAGTTPGHSFEFARLILQYWDLSGRPEDGSPKWARRLFETALSDATDHKRGGFIYTVDFEGNWIRSARYWWPVTEAIGACAAFLKLERSDADEKLYRELWEFAAHRLIDFGDGGWFPELNDENRPAAVQFAGKPDIYHSIQATLFPLSGRLSAIAENLRDHLRAS